MDLSDSLTARPRSPARKGQLTAGFVAIIAFKYFKACVFLLIGVAAMKLARLPSMPTAHDLAAQFRFDPENELIRRLAHLLREITRGQVIGFGVLSLFAGAVFAAEGTLLAARIWWSTYFTITLTALGIPLEIFEILRRPGEPRRYVLFLVNLAILVYLWRRRHEFRVEPAASV
jgi:uncharacterized membrane protein (DUF2068 family)